MKCGVGKCGRCNIGNKYVCKDGPVFRLDQLDELPANIDRRGFQMEKWCMFIFLASNMKCPPA